MRAGEREGASSKYVWGHKGCVFWGVWVVGRTKRWGGQPHVAEVGVAQRLCCGTEGASLERLGKQVAVQAGNRGGSGRPGTVGRSMCREALTGPRHGCRVRCRSDADVSYLPVTGRKPLYQPSEDDVMHVFARQPSHDGAWCLMVPVARCMSAGCCGGRGHP
jgi:hypothetical protein